MRGTVKVVSWMRAYPSVSARVAPEADTEGHHQLDSDEQRFQTAWLHIDDQGVQHLNRRQGMVTRSYAALQ